MNSNAKVVLLLTACINPVGVIHTQRIDAKIRFNDYRGAIKNYLDSPGSTPIVFCDNSGYDLTELKDFCRVNNVYGRRVEFLSFNGMDISGELGKGYGELAIIKHALVNSKFISPESMILKITGRLCVLNIEKIIKVLSGINGVEVFSDLKKELTYSDSRVFCASFSFFNNYFFPMHGLINDSKNMYFENVLARAIHKSLADGFIWSMLPFAPDIKGYSGTLNVPISRFFMKRLLKIFIHKAKVKILKI